MKVKNSIENILNLDLFGMIMKNFSRIDDQNLINV